MKTIEVCRIEPVKAGTSDNLDAPTLLPLTFFDILWLRLPPVERLFYYEFPESASSFFDSVLPKLKRSLAVALHYYRPLAGNLRWSHDSHKPVVECVAGDAVRLTVAESDAHFNHLSGSDLCETNECRHLIPHLTASHEQASVIALQVTLFPNLGFCIGISSHHAVLDGKTSTSFMKSWAYLCYKSIQQSSSSSALPPELIPFYDRAAIRDPNELETRYLTDWLNHGGPNNRSLKFWDLQVVDPESTRGVFELTSPNIEKLKKYVKDRYKQNKELHLSTFTLSLAYAWVCKVRAEEIKASKVCLGFAVDCRQRLEPPIPPTYFGNCIGGRLSVVETVGLLGENGLILAVEAISEALETLKDGVLYGAENWVSILQNGLSTDDRLIGTAGSPRFQVYGADFGWGRPKKVEMTSVNRTGAIFLSESRNGNGGVEIGLVLKKCAMDAFASLFVKGLENL